MLSNLIRIVVITSSLILYVLQGSGKAFCAGGDVATVIRNVIQGRNVLSFLSVSLIDVMNLNVSQVPC